MPTPNENDSTLATGEKGTPNPSNGPNDPPITPPKPVTAQPVNPREEDYPDARLVRPCSECGIPHQTNDARPTSPCAKCAKKPKNALKEIAPSGDKPEPSTSTPGMKRR